MAQSREARRRRLLVSSSLTVAQLRADVEQRTGVPAARQRLVLLEERLPGRAAQLALAATRGLLKLLVAALACLAAACRWALGLPTQRGGDAAAVHLVSTSGRELELAGVGPGTTLAEMTAAAARHGESVDRVQLRCSPG